MVARSALCSWRDVNVPGALCQGQELRCDCCLDGVRCFRASPAATLAPGSSVACKRKMLLHQSDPLVSKVQAAFPQSFGNCTRMGKVSCIPHSDFGCWQSSLDQGLAMGDEESGCCVCSGDLLVQGGRMWGKQAGQELSNGASAFRVRNREVFLSSNEVCLGKKKCRPDVQWIQGTLGSCGVGMTDWGPHCVSYIVWSVNT